MMELVDQQLIDRARTAEAMRFVIRLPDRPKARARRLKELLAKQKTDLPSWPVRPDYVSQSPSRRARRSSSRRSPPRRRKGG